MSFVEFLGRHGRSIVLAAAGLALAGAAAAISLPVGLFPQVSFPRVVVTLDAGSRPADQTALLITRPIEEAVRTVPGVRNVRSNTSRGSAQVSIDFGWGRDMVASTLLVDSAIAAALPDLPAGTHYDVKRMDPTVFPIISYALQSDRLDGVALRDLARLQLVPLLSAIPGLARIDVQGGDIAEIEVLADVHRLAAHGVALADLARVIGAGNVLQSVGRLEDHDRLFLVLADRAARDAAAIGDLVLTGDANGIVRVRDVASVQTGVAPQWTRVVEDGRPAVLFNVYEQPDGNAVAIAAAVREKLAGFAMPAGVRLVNWYDQSELVTQSATSVRDAVLIGLVLAGLVLLAFLRSLRVTLVAILTVPATLAATILPLSLLGLSFNIMTLGGIAAAVGLLIDDGIVMIEHIARSTGQAGRDAVLPAARSFMRPLAASSLATLIVFLPLGFLSGVTGAFASALSVTMAAALAISWAMTAFVVPVLARNFIDFRRWRDPGEGPPGRLGRTHAALLAGLFRRPWILALVLLPLLALGYIAYGAVPTGFMPAVDEGGFVMDYYAKPGTSLTETSREVAQVDAILRAQPEVATFSRRLGAGLGGDLFESYHGDYFVRLKPGHARPTELVMEAVRVAVESQVPGVQIEAAQLMEDLIGDLTAVPQPIEVKIYGADPAALIPVADRVAALVGKIDGVVEVKSGVVLAGDAIDLRLDPARAALEGMTPDEVTQAVSNALEGTVATELPGTNQSIAVRVRVPDAYKLRETELMALPLRAGDGHVLPLSRVATLATVTGQAEIGRENLEPMLAVTGRIEGRGIGAAIADVKAALGQPNVLGRGMRYELGGLYAQQQIAFAGLARVFVAALAAEFLLLLALYESFSLPAIILGCGVLASTAVFTALWVTGVALNITALMGLTMVIGIGTEMAIFYVSEYVELARDMPGREALIAASHNRLRPITMTTLAAILTLLPLALAIGAGSGIQQPLAIAIIGGLALQYPLVLLGMPVLIGLTLKREPARG